MNLLPKNRLERESTLKAHGFSRGLAYTAGQAHCPYDECDWWVPVGMEYLYATHRREDYDEFCEKTDRNQ